MKSLDINLELPDDAEISSAQKDSAQAAAKEAALLDLYRSGALGGYHAARLLHMEYYDFLDLLAARGIPASKVEPQPERVREARGDFGNPDKQSP